MSEVKTNKITSLASNNDITLDPDGTGKTVVQGGDDNYFFGVKGATYGLRYNSNTSSTQMMIEAVDDTLVASHEPLFIGGSTVNLGIAGSTKVVIASDGKVGIGDEGNINFIDSGDTNIGRIQYDHSTDQMDFRVNDTVRMCIRSGGEVNIGSGSSSPTGAQGKKYCRPIQHDI